MTWIRSFFHIFWCDWDNKERGNYCVPKNRISKLLDLLAQAGMGSLTSPFRHDDRSADR